MRATERRVDLRPERVAYRPGDEAALLVDSDRETGARLIVSHLGSTVRELETPLAAGRGRVSLGAFPAGSYAVRLTAYQGGSGSETTGFDVLDDPMSRPRYGFVSQFPAGRDDAAALADSLRAFHLNAVQLYDWMYRHASLLPPTPEFADALGRPLSLATVRSVVATVHDVGARAIAYAAVYGAGEEYAAAHPDQVLRHRSGSPWRLGDFLSIMDVRPGSPWTRHIVGQMRAAVAEMGFDGLHLDQYGDPKLAVGDDGSVVDLAEGFADLVGRVRDELPSATLIFNNVNDFPSRRMWSTPQDATYVEVWPPHDTYADLARLVDVARAGAPGRPVILAAYLQPFAGAAGAPEVAAAKLALATVWAVGGQYLLFGERDGVLTHPYYPDHATLPPPAARELRRFADFAVANGDVLTAPEYADATRSLAFGINGDVDVAGVAASPTPEPGRVWLRVAEHGRRLVIQLLDYRGQPDGRWNAPRKRSGTLSATVRVRVASSRPRVVVGHPSAGADLQAVPFGDDGEHITVSLDDAETWALLVVDR